MASFTKISLRNTRLRTAKDIGYYIFNLKKELKRTAYVSISNQRQKEHDRIFSADVEKKRKNVLNLLKRHILRNIWKDVVSSIWQFGKKDYRKSWIFRIILSYFTNEANFLSAFHLIIADYHRVVHWNQLYTWYTFQICHWAAYSLSTFADYIMLLFRSI